MNNKKFKSLVAVLLSAVVALSCFGTVAFAADVTIISKPSKTTYYQGIDWAYNKSGTISIIGGDFDLSGTVLSYNSEKVSYAIDKWPNMYSRCADGKWKVGTNTMKIYCDDFPSSVYATLEVNLIAVDSITVVVPPSKTNLIEDKDWKMSGLGDVEFTELDLSGIKLRVKYTDGTTKYVSYPENELIGWAVSQDVDYLEPGKATLYATFCGKRAPFEVNFIVKDAKLAGDVNQDFKINSLDALMVLQYSVGSISLDGTRKTQADVSDDGTINSLDALMILQYSVGSIPSL